MPRKDPTLEAFGKCVSLRRKDGKLSQEQLAERAELDRTYVSDIERGQRNPGIKNVVRIAKALGITTSELCKGIDA